MKRADKIMIPIIIIALVLGGWYFYNQKYIGVELNLSSTDSGQEIDSKVVELYKPEGSCMTDIFTEDMSKRKGTYFIFEEKDYEHFTNKGVTEDEFNKISANNGEKVSKKAAAQMKAFFNSSYEDIPKDKEPSEMYSDYKSMLFSPGIEAGLHYTASGLADEFEKEFGGDADKFFLNHQLKLSCDTISVDKLGYCNFVHPGGDEPFNFLYATGSAEVYAEGIGNYEKTADFLPANGETIKIDYAVCFEYYIDGNEIVFQELMLSSKNGKFSSLIN